MTERDPIERLEASDGLPIEPSPEFAEELRIMLDLRLRMPDQGPARQRNLFDRANRQRGAAT